MSNDDTKLPVAGPKADYTKAGEELDWFGAKLTGFLGVSADLKRVGSLRQAADEAQARVDSLKAEEKGLAGKVKTARDAADGKIEKINAAAEQAESDAEVRRQQVIAEISEAKNEAADINLKASAAADLLIADAAARAKDIVAKAQIELTGLKTLIADLRNESDRLKAENVGEAKMLAAYKSQMADLRQRLTA